MSYNNSRNCTIYNFQSSQHLSKYSKYMCWTSWSSFFLTHQETRKLSSIYKVKLHNPGQDITLIRSNVKGTEIDFHEGFFFFFFAGNSSPLSIAVINKKSGT